MENSSSTRAILIGIAIANLIMSVYYSLTGRFGSFEFILHTFVFISILLVYKYYSLVKTG